MCLEVVEVLFFVYDSFFIVCCGKLYGIIIL